MSTVSSPVTAPPHPTFIAPGAGPALLAGGSGTVIKFSSEQLAGSFSLVEHPIDPGVLIPPHVHSREDQISLVLEGTIEMLVGEETYHCPVGTYLHKPRGLPHAFWNSGDVPGRLLEISVPGGAERYMKNMFEYLIESSGTPDPAVLAGLAAEYGITLLPQLAGELIARHHLRPMVARPRL